MLLFSKAAVVPRRTLFPPLTAIMIRPFDYKDLFMRLANRLGVWMVEGEKEHEEEYDEGPQARRAVAPAWNGH